MPKADRERGPFGSVKQEAMYNLLRTAKLFESVVNGFLKRYDLTIPQLSILRALQTEHPSPLTMSEIKRRQVTQGPDVTRLVDQLVKRGLVERYRPDDLEGKDRRIVTATSTSKGMDLLKALGPQLLDLYQREWDHITDGDLKTMSKLLMEARRLRDPWLPGQGVKHERPKRTVEDE